MRPKRPFSLVTASYSKGMRGVYDHWLKGEFQQGVDAFRNLPEPSPAERRWAGLCLLEVGQHFEAEQQLARAALGGVAGGWIGLMYLHLMQGNEELALKAQHEAERLPLCREDQVRLARQQSLLVYQGGDLVQATEHLKRAWLLSQDDPEGSPQLCALALQLGGMYAIRGLETAANPYLQYALKYSQGMHLVVIQGLHALHLGYQGRHMEAKELITQALDAAVDYPRAQLGLLYEQAVIERLAGHLETSLGIFEKVAGMADESGEVETARYAELGRIAVLHELGRDDEAKLPLTRMEQLASSEVIRQHLNLRRESLQDRPDVETLRQCALFFTGKQYMREAGWAWLHLAEGELRAGNRSAAESALREVMAVRYAIGHGESLKVEVRSLPALQVYLREGATEPVCQLSDLLSGSVRPVLSLNTLGRSRLLLNGTEVKFPLRRTLEVLAYLLEHPACTLPEVQLSLFPDTPPAQSKSYFHQVREALRQGVPGLNIPYDPATRQYTVHWDGELHYDAAELRVLLTGTLPLTVEVFQRYSGPFLPEADSEWADDRRDTLQQEVLKVGIASIEAYISQEKWREAAEVLSLLHPLDPLSEGLNQLQLLVTRQVAGEAAARHLSQEYRRRVEREMGGVTRKSVN